MAAQAQNDRYTEEEIKTIKYYLDNDLALRTSLQARCPSYTNIGKRLVELMPPQAHLAGEGKRTVDGYKLKVQNIRAKEAQESLARAKRLLARAKRLEEYSQKKSQKLKKVKSAARDIINSLAGKTQEAESLSKSMATMREEMAKLQEKMDQNEREREEEKAKLVQAEKDFGDAEREEAKARKDAEAQREMVVEKDTEIAKVTGEKRRLEEENAANEAKTRETTDQLCKQMASERDNNSKILKMASHVFNQMSEAQASGAAAALKLNEERQRLGTGEASGSAADEYSQVVNALKPAPLIEVARQIAAFTAAPQAAAQLAIGDGSADMHADVGDPNGKGKM